MLDGYYDKETWSFPEQKKFTENIVYFILGLCGLLILMVLINFWGLILIVVVSGVVSKLSYKKRHSAFEDFRASNRYKIVDFFNSSAWKPFFDKKDTDNKAAFRFWATAGDDQGYTVWALIANTRIFLWTVLVTALYWFVAPRLFPDVSNGTLEVLAPLVSMIPSIPSLLITLIFTFTPEKHPSIRYLYNTMDEIENFRSKNSYAGRQYIVTDVE